MKIKITTGLQMHDSIQKKNNVILNEKSLLENFGLKLTDQTVFGDISE